MATLLLLTRALTPSVRVLPGLELLSHTVKVLNPEPTALLAAPPADAILVDGRSDLSSVRSLCRLLETTGNTMPVLMVTTEGGLAAVTSEWGIDDVILESAGPAEIEARLRLIIGRATASPELPSSQVANGDLLIDEASYSAKLRGRSLDLTYKEFELLKFLAQHPGRVFTRDQLLQEVWGYDYFGGTRTVDVHVRRLRDKLPPLADAIVTVKQFGYKLLDPPPA